MMKRVLVTLALGATVAIGVVATPTTADARWHHDGAVVDRYQESIDLAHHLLGKQRSLRMRLPMFAAIGKSALRGQSQKGLLDALSRPAQQDALSADQSWARRREFRAPLPWIVIGLQGSVVASDPRAA
jgi:hypothetical protein